MAIRADLHIHTTASDGTWTPADLIEEAQRCGIGLLAVTDHDSVANVAEAGRLAAQAGIGCLPGAEICSTKGDLSFHILGYGIDITNKPLVELMRHNEDLLEQKDVDSIRLLARDGWNVDEAEFARYTYDRRRGGWRALAYLIDKGLCTGVNDFFQRIFTPEHDLGFPTFPAISEVIAAIHGAGGVALCAHAASGFHGPGLEQVMDLLRVEGFDGFECYHSNHSVEGTQRLLRHCEKHKLLISGGSDCHGTFVPGRHLGEPYVDTEMLKLPFIDRL